MVKYSCERCGKEFSQKSHYDSHNRRKTPCENNADKIKSLVDKAVEEKLKELNKKVIVENTEEVIINTKVISLFTGIGGMDMGFDGEVIVHKDSIINKEFIDKPYTINDFVVLKKNNFDCVFQNDILKGAKEVFGFNNDNSKYNTTSIYNLIAENFVFPKADIVIGGFPCQDFSHAGKRKGFKSNKGHDLKEKVDIEKENSRGTLYKSFVEVVKKVQPKMFVAENVYGLITMENEPIKQIMNDFAELGYDVNYQIVYCPEFGIPQTRKRVIIMGISKERSVNINEGWNIITKNKTECCIGKYFEHLVEPNITNDISQMVYSKAKKLEKGQGQTEINLDTFAPTMRAEHHGNIEFRRHSNSKININENTMIERRLTVREAGLIQTFPPDYVFSKKKNMVAYKYIGNAVPPLLGYLIADKVNELCKRHFA
jgi:DNA (cytosine-5)-methyltransferase 1|tara:strand:+ start:897 stop:2180 length:1284 start_codon:yes stop_codon:yes gene_type:complete